jgi:DNA-binding CsgD family transcriptional regulator
LPFAAREREIVALLAKGLSNREVADRLCLSVRTIEGHIYRAMARTGVANRQELAGLLQQRS